jgi:ferredoxin
MSWMVGGKELEGYQRVVVDQDICIECGVCVAACPFQAWELDEKGKARLIWDKCQDDFSCVAVCPVSCIWRSSEAPDEARAKKGWFRFSRDLNDEERKIFADWNKKFSINT